MASRLTALRGRNGRPSGLLGGVSATATRVHVLRAASSIAAQSGATASGLELTVPGYGADALLVDEVVLNAHGGRGGDGEAQERDKGRTVRNFKYSSGRNLRKKMFLRAGAPTDGGDGGDVICVCDPALKDLGHIVSATNKRSRVSRANTKQSANINNAVVFRGPKGASADLSLSLVATRQKHGMEKAKDCELRVPPGTVVMRARGGSVLGECLAAGDRVTIARGGRGGLGVREPPTPQRRGGGGGGENAYGTYSDDVADDKWRLEAKGLDGEHVTVRLVLRMMIDVGLVGLPNAGKSSLLRAMTRAAPKVAPYPFTTLAPSLGVLVARTGDEADEGTETGDDIEQLHFYDESGDARSVHEAEEAAEEEQSARAAPRSVAAAVAAATETDAKPIIGDLPGLIEGAHIGRGLGRVFLKHIRRARVLCYVIDLANVDMTGSSDGQTPVRDFECLYEELRMYNPEYVRRPALIVLNKVDVLLADPERGADAIAATVAELEDAAQRKYDGSCVPPPQVLTTSALTGEGTARLAASATALLTGT